MDGHELVPRNGTADKTAKKNNVIEFPSRKAQGAAMRLAA